MENLLKRVKGAAWVTLGGFIVTVVGLILEHIEAFSLTPMQQTIALILGTAIVTQITKYLNSEKNGE